MTDRITIRPSRPDDAPLAAAVFRLSLGAFGEYIFGPNGHLIEVGLMRLFSGNAGRFGYELSSTAELNRHPLGLITAFPGADGNRLSLASMWHLPRAFGWRALGVAARMLSFASGTEGEADEYYISHLGVLPAAQGHGMGKHLLLHAETTAQSLGFKKISLIVALDNHDAQRLYQRYGYEIVTTWHDKNPIGSYHRMLKNIG